MSPTQDRNPRDENAQALADRGRVAWTNIKLYVILPVMLLALIAGVVAGVVAIVRNQSEKAEEARAAEARRVEEAGNEARAREKARQLAEEAAAAAAAAEKARLELAARKARAMAPSLINDDTALLVIADQDGKPEWGLMDELARRLGTDRRPVESRALTQEFYDLGLAHDLIKAGPHATLASLHIKPRFTIAGTLTTQVSPPDEHGYFTTDCTCTLTAYHPQGRSLANVTTRASGWGRTREESADKAKEKLRLNLNLESFAKVLSQ